MLPFLGVSAFGESLYQFHCKAQVISTRWCVVILITQLWGKLMVGQELTSRVSKDWQDIGFQGNDPATDFRGMGTLGLQCLQYPQSCVYNYT